ncbi:hypothetical protein N826_03835 [Skermanella aerolata KACC 11604]|nr:hypothetical protein N826_03835 [Skermanella aerolata KACC 11604]
MALPGPVIMSYEFAFDGVLVVEQEPAMPARGIESRLGEPFLLNVPPGAPRIHPDPVQPARFLTRFGIGTRYPAEEPDEIVLKRARRHLGHHRP